MSKQPREIGDDALAALESRLGYVFRDRAVLEHALTHPSYTVEDFSDNERLEFLGDSVLSLTVNEHLFHSMPESSEGELTRIKSAVVSTVSLAKVSRSMDLSKFMRLGKGLGNHGSLPDSVHANVLEAVFAAVYLDGGLHEAAGVILRLLGPEIAAMTASAGSENAKSQLQELAQREMGSSPRYRVLSERGPQHGKVFVVAVELKGRRFPEFSGHTKKEAEQGAARLALEALRATVPASRTEAPVAAPAEVPAAGSKGHEAAPRKSRRSRRRRSGSKQPAAGKGAGGASGQTQPAKPRPREAPASQPAKEGRPAQPSPRHPGRGRAKTAKNPYDTLG